MQGETFQNMISFHTHTPSSTLQLKVLPPNSAAWEKKTAFDFEVPTCAFQAITQLQNPVIVNYVVVWVLSAWLCAFKRPRISLWGWPQSNFLSLLSLSRHWASKKANSTFESVLPKMLRLQAGGYYGRSFKRLWILGANRQGGREALAKETFPSRDIKKQSLQSAERLTWVTLWLHLLKAKDISVAWLMRSNPSWHFRNLVSDLRRRKLFYSEDNKSNELQEAESEGKPCFCPNGWKLPTLLIREGCFWRMARPLGNTSSKTQG